MSSEKGRKLARPESRPGAQGALASRSGRHVQWVRTADTEIVRDAIMTRRCDGAFSIDIVQNEKFVGLGYGLDQPEAKVASVK